MSTIEVNKITPVSGGTTVQVGESGDTINIPAGATIANAGTATGFGVSLANGADNRVVTASSASALNGEANLTYNGTFLGVGADADQGTGVHVKVSDSGATAWTSANQLIVEKSGDSGITLLNSTSGESFLAYGDSDNNTAGMVSYDHSDNHMELWTGGSEQMRIDGSGNVYVGRGTNKYLEVGNTSSYYSRIHSNRPGTAAQDHINFNNANGKVGGVATSNNSTIYETSSDYRLKENEVAISNGIERLKQLKPYRFNFKNDKENTFDGFFAHEVQTVIPEAVTGVKDEIDEEGNIDAQGIDQSKIVPLLTKALQEAITKIETLETENTDIKARLTTLESA